MRIFNNIPALQTYNNLNATNSAFGKSITNLSSGLRINSAADDAAGLAISEKMRAQIKGLDQAARNSQDGISMIQTAEGALNEGNSILQRMRELAVQSANDTLTSNDRQYIQLEIDQLKDELDRISSTTQFNKRKLLDGSSDVLWSSDKLSTKATVNGQINGADGNYKISVDVIDTGQAEVQKSNILIKTRNPDDLRQKKADIVFLIDTTGSMGAHITKVKNAISGLANALYAEHIDAHFGLVGYGDVYDNEPITRYDMTDNLNVFQNNLNNLPPTGGGDAPESSLEAVEHAELNYRYRDDAAVFYVLITDVAGSDDTAPPYVPPAMGGFDKGEFDVVNMADELYGKNRTLFLIGSPGADNPTTAEGHMGVLADKTDGNFYDIGAADYLPLFDAISTKVIEKAPVTDMRGTPAKLFDRLENTSLFGSSSLLSQELMIHQNNKNFKLVLYASDTVQEMVKKLNDILAYDLDQAKYVENLSTNFASFVDQVIFDGTSESVISTILIRSAIPGAAGKIHFSGDEALLNALGFNTIQETRESTFNVSVSDAHSGKPIADNIKVSGNTVQGLIHENIDVTFDPLADMSVVWNDTMKRFDFVKKDTVYETFIHLAGQSTILQVGANEKEEMNLSFGNTSSAALGVSNVLVNSRELAVRAITQIDNAMTKMLNFRSKLGAYQNRLEYTVNNLTSAAENLTASESRIRDLDMAKEMMELTKLQILSQSGQSMLSQANQLPQAVLSLLRQ